MYTRSDLDEDIDRLNVKLTNMAHRNRIDRDYHLETQGRNGYTAVDLYYSPTGCDSNLGTGSPKDCWNIACRWFFAIS